MFHEIFLEYPMLRLKMLKDAEACLPASRRIVECLYVKTLGN